MRRVNSLRPGSCVMFITGWGVLFSQALYPVTVEQCGRTYANQTQAAKSEISRAIVGRGTVVRHMRDGSTQILFATGEFSGGQLRCIIVPLHTAIFVVRGGQSLVEPV